jgi:6-phosphogluconolactonase
MPGLTIYPDQVGLVHGAAEFLTRQALAAVAARGRFTLALAGGGTPRPVYELLATPDFAGRMPWRKVHVCFGDERCVPPTDRASNYRMAREALLDHVPVPAANVHRIAGEDDPARAATAYEQELRRVFPTVAFPDLDVVCLGLGENGHTASLFPGTASLRELERWVVAQYVESMGAWRVTVTAPLINAARQVIFLVSGAGKAAVLAEVLHGPYQPDVLPAQLVRPPAGRIHWLVDAAAGAGLPPQTGGERP